MKAPRERTRRPLAASRARLRRAHGWTRERLARVTPGPRAWRGARVGVVAVVSVVLLAAGSMLASGRGLLADGLLVLAAGWLVVLLAAGALLLLGRLLRGVPVRARAVGVTAVVVLAIPFVVAGPYALALGALLVVGGALAGAGAASLLGPDAPPRPGHRARAVLAVGGVVLGGLLVAGVTVWLLAPGGRDDGAAPPPGGDLPVATFTYGSGDHPRRSEFGSGVALRTAAVDASRMLPSWAGWRGAVRTRYWGFGPDALPRNATVWYPEAEGRFPLVLIVHGNAPMERPSDTGYAWLARDLASRGYVVASVDENFLNITLARGLDLGRENDARAWLLLEHLRLWRDWADDPTHPVHERVDLDRVGLVGHSRGGEAVATAAAFDGMDRYPEDASLAFDAGFGIDAVVALAPVDGQYQPAGRPTALQDVSYLALHGGLDGDVFSFYGLRQYQRTTLTGDAEAVKAAVYLPDANHGQFNTVWGRQDLGGFGGRVLDIRAIMPAETQRAAAGIAIVGFLDATLRDEPDALAPLADPGHAVWPAGADVITRLADDTEVTLAGFDEDADPATGTLPGTRLHADGLHGWREAALPLRWDEQATNAAHLEWEETAAGAPPAFRLELPAGWEAPPEPVLTLTLAGSDAATADRGAALAGSDGPSADGAASSTAADADALDLTVEVIDAAGATLRTSLAEHGGVPAAQPSRRLKWPLPEWVGDLEPIGQTVRIPLGDEAGGLDTTALREIRLVFDRTPAAAVYVEHVGVAAGERQRRER